MYTTEEEIKYLDKIGTFHESVKKRTSRKILLDNYIKTTSFRKKWGTLDKLKIIYEAERLRNECL